MMDYILGNLVNIGALVLIAYGVIFKLPKFILWLYRAKKYGPPDIPSDHHKPKGPQDYL